MPFRNAWVHHSQFLVGSCSLIYSFLYSVLSLFLSSFSGSLRCLYFYNLRILITPLVYSYRDISFSIHMATVGVCSVHRRRVPPLKQELHHPWVLLVVLLFVLRLLITSLVSSIFALQCINSNDMESYYCNNSMFWLFI